MTKTRKSKKHSQNRLLRGFTAVALSAAVLAAVVFLLVLRQPRESDLPEVETDPFLSDFTPESTSPLGVNPYGPEDFSYEGDYLACLAGPALLGVDVSAHQGEIDWEQVRDAGMEFAIIRIGYRGYTSGGLYPDEYAQDNLEGAKKAGLKVGVYFYSQAINPTEAALEAAYCIQFLKDWELDLPVVYDWEYVNEEARTANMDEQTLMACAKTFCDAVEDAGYDAMVYFNPSLAESLLNLEELLEYPFWLAMYSDRMTWPYKVDMWQYTASGTVPGIEGNTDINLWFVG